MRVIHIENSYNVWSTETMYWLMLRKCPDKYTPERYLNRTFCGLCIEWYLHNIGYCLTLPFIKYDSIKVVNERFKHVDLEERG